MANRFNNPFPQFMDATPTMLSGAKLFFYTSGTSAKLNTYSDSALSSANTNPIILNSAGRAAVDIFLQDLNYKVVLAPSTDTDPPTSPIWTADPVSARDSKLIAKTLTGSGSPSGAVAGTAGSASILPDFYWDYTNSILYVCTATGTTSTAVWTAINASTAANVIPSPQGYLTLTSGTPSITGDQDSVSTIYYTPDIGNTVPVYNGTVFTPLTFAELTLSLVASHTANSIYDLFVFSNSGVVTLVTGPAWSVSTAGSGARGAGAGTTELTKISGLYVNANQFTGRNGSTTYTVAANVATYLGTVSMNNANGQTSCFRAWGAARKWGLWNAYNRRTIYLKEGDTTVSWSPAGATFGPTNANTNNYVEILVGLQDEICDVKYIQNAGITVAASSVYQTAIGVNSTTTRSGIGGEISGTLSGGATLTMTSIPVTSRHVFLPAIGKHTLTALERVSNAATPRGGEDDMMLCATYRG